MVAALRAIGAPAPKVKKPASSSADRGTAQDGREWRDIPLFDGLTTPQAEALRGVMREKSFATGEYVVREGEPASELFIVRQGSVEILKRERERAREHRIGCIARGETVGEMSLIDQGARSASVRALEPTDLWSVPFDQLRSTDPERPEGALLDGAFHQMVLNLAQTLSTRLREKGDESLQDAQARVAIGRFIVNVLILLCVYALTLASLPYVDDAVPRSTSYVSLPLQALFGIVSWRFMRESGYPLRLFGITKDGWRQSLRPALVVTVVFVAAATCIKWLAVRSSPSFVGVPVIELRDIYAYYGGWRYVAFLAAYGVSTLVQEAIVRGSLQSSLEIFLVGPRRVIAAVLLSNLLFAVTHLHISIEFALMSFAPGLVWGWMFHHHRNLWGVAASHFVVGAYAFFVLGVVVPLPP